MLLVSSRRWVEIITKGNFDITNRPGRLRNGYRPNEPFPGASLVEEQQMRDI